MSEEVEMVETRWLERPEGRIAYEVSGEGPLVVCVPGMGDLRSTFRHLVPVLTAAGLRVAALDLRGHGDSATTFTTHDDVAAGSDALALVETLGGGPAVLVGSSMGAGAAVWASVERPDLVAGLVLVGPFVRNPPVSRLMLGIMRLLLRRPWIRLVWRWYLPTLYAGTTPVGHAAHLAAIDASLRDGARAAAFAATTRTSHGPAEDRLDEVSVPVLVVMGEQDPDFARPDPAAEATWIAQRLDGEVLMVPSAGHYPHAQRPDVVAPRVAEFVRGAVRRA